MVKLLGLDPIAIEPDSHIAHRIGENAADVAQLHDIGHRPHPKVFQKTNPLLARSYDLDQPGPFWRSIRSAPASRSLAVTAASSSVLLPAYAVAS